MPRLLQITVLLACAAGLCCWPVLLACAAGLGVPTGTCPQFQTTERVLHRPGYRPDVLDPALLRPGRFDRRVSVDRPDRVGRQQILRVHLRNKGLPLANDVSVEELSGMTTGFTGGRVCWAAGLLGCWAG
jgi:hypothetical protein